MMNNVQRIDEKRIEEYKQRHREKIDIKKIKCVYYLPWKRPLNWPYNVWSFIRSLKDRYVRGKYGVAHVDCWAFDFYFYNQLRNAILMYRRDTLGTPPNLTEEEWYNILTRIIELCDILILDESPEDEELYKKSLETKDTKDRDAWLDEAYKWYEYQQECRDELMDILKEWLPHIWW